MKKNQTMLWGVGVIAVGAICYFAFFYPPPSSENLSATVGAVQKHQTAQITDEDVYIAGEAASIATDPEVITAMASLLERASIQDQAAAFQRASRQEQVGLLGRASMQDYAGLWGRANIDEQVAMFGRVDKDMQAAMLGRMNITADA